MGVSELHFRVLYLLGAAGVLVLLRRPLRNPDRPGSRWFALTVVAVAAWLGGVGLYYFSHSLAGSLALYNVVLFSITVCFAGWILIAVEFTTGRDAPRWLVAALGAFAAVHFLLLWTNYVWVHELVYRATTFVDAGGGLNAHRGPLFWVHIVVVYLLVALSTVLFVAEWVNADGLRQRQAGILAVTPLAGVAASLLWFAEVLPFPFDPTPVGVTVGVLLLSWALFRAEFLEIVPVASRRVVEEMTDAVVTLDDEDRVVDWNPAALELFGVEEPSVGTPAAEFFESVPRDTLASFTESGRREIQASFELGGRRRHLSVLVSPIETGEDGPVGRVIVVRDITGIKRRETQLVKQNEYLEEFAEIVSHDLQGPLMEIRGNADLVARTGEAAHAQPVLEAVDRMEQLVDDLLRLARTGRTIDAVEPVGLADVAEAAWTHVWSANAELVVESDRTVLADPGRLQQLFENLFRNSVDHAAPAAPDSTADARPDTRDRAASDGSGDADHARSDAASGRRGPREAVRVTVSPHPDGFSVEDDGPGVPPEDRERVFARGYTTAGDGMGLGLSIVRQIAGAHGWSVRVTEGTDGGARFEFTGVDVPEDDGRP